MLMCIDFQWLNSIMIIDRYSIPRVNNLLDCLYSDKYYIKVDINNDFHYIYITLRNIHKTAFMNRWGLYEYAVLPFSLTNASATFLHMMNNILRDFLDKYIYHSVC